MDCKSNFKTLVVIDLETTGLTYDEPKITELAMVAVCLSTLHATPAAEQLPRILNKFVKFFNPNKSIRSKATELSDLNNQMLADYAPFNCETVKAIEAFLNDFPRPICFVAHNGNIFDFPIFFAEIQSALSSISSDSTNNTGDENGSKIQTNAESSLASLACVDSLSFFRAMYRLLNEEDPREESGGQRSTTKNDLTYQTHELPESVNSAMIHRGYVEIPMKSNVTQLAPSMKLVNIYEREFNQPSPWKSHRAEDDCLILLALLKLYLPDWLLWMDDHHRPLRQFSSLPLKSTVNLPPKIEKKVKRPLKF